MWGVLTSIHLCYVYSPLQDENKINLHVFVCAPMYNIRYICTSVHSIHRLIPARIVPAAETSTAAYLLCAMCRQKLQPIVGGSTLCAPPFNLFNPCFTDCSSHLVNGRRPSLSDFLRWIPSRSVTACSVRNTSMTAQPDMCPRFHTP